MSNSVSIADDAPATAAKEEPPPQDGWRNGGLPALRAELDRIDDTLHDLLMQRAEIVEHVARSGKPAAFRPGREASIIRRLLARHRGALPPVTLVRIWRELLAGTTAMQGGFSLAVCDTAPPPDGRRDAPLIALAREHFGALTQVRACSSPGQALAEVAEGAVSVAVLAYPSQADDWWVALLHHQPRLYVIGRLPFWKPRPDGFPAAQAVVVASTPPDASDEDRSLLGFQCDSDLGQSRLVDELAAVGLRPESIVLARRQGSLVTSALVEVNGILADDDSRLLRLCPGLRRPVVLGSYAVPTDGGAR